MAAAGPRRTGGEGRRLRATAPTAEQAAREHGFDVRPFTSFGRLYLAIDGTAKTEPAAWLVKGGGGAHTREKVVAAATEPFVVIASANKLVAALAPPIPLELLWIYAAEAGNLLRLLATGGIYIGGGIAPHILRRMRQRAFLDSLTAKGRFRSMLEQIPVHVILNEQTGLFGAARLARREPAHIHGTDPLR